MSKTVVAGRMPMGSGGLKMEKEGVAGNFESTGFDQVFRVAGSKGKNRRELKNGKSAKDSDYFLRQWREKGRRKGGAIGREWQGVGIIRGAWINEEI